MRRLLAVSLAAFALSGTHAVLAEDAPTHTLPTKTTWTVGDVVTRAKSEKMVQAFKVTANEQVVQEAKTTVETSFESVTVVREVDDDGDHTKALVYFKSWRRAAGTDVDESLTGAHVEVTGTGATRGAKVVTPDHKISVEAAQWLDNELGKGAGDREGKANEVLHPGKPVAVGETWNPAIAKVCEMFGNDGAQKFIEEKCTAAVTLTAVEAKVATVRFETDLATPTLATPVGQFPWTEGGVLVVRATVRRGLDAGRHNEGAEMTARLHGKATGPGESVVLFELDVTNSGTMAPGGEMPALAEPAAVK